MSSGHVKVAVDPLVAKMDEIREHLDGIAAGVESLPAIPTDAMTYTELKMQLMVSYVANLSFYLSLKSRGESVANHPVFHQLAYLRTFIERIVPLDASLKYQIDKLLLEEARNEQVDGADEEAGESGPAARGPNLQAFMPSMSSAVKNITVDQVKKNATTALPEVDVSMNRPAPGGRLEIDPSLIAAQIQRAQAGAGAQKKRKVKTYVEQDSGDERADNSDVEEEELEMPVKAVKKAKAKAKTGKKMTKKEEADDEEIDSDFDL